MEPRAAYRASAYSVEAFPRHAAHLMPKSEGASSPEAMRASMRSWRVLILSTVPYLLPLGADDAFEEDEEGAAALLASRAARSAAAAALRASACSTARALASSALAARSASIRCFASKSAAAFASASASLARMAAFCSGRRGEEDCEERGASRGAGGVGIISGAAYPRVYERVLRLLRSGSLL